jgi:hypothetical protein
MRIQVDQNRPQSWPFRQPQSPTPKWRTGRVDAASAGPGSPPVTYPISRTICLPTSQHGPGKAVVPRSERRGLREGIANGEEAHLLPRFQTFSPTTG